MRHLAAPDATPHSTHTPPSPMLLLERKILVMELFASWLFARNQNWLTPGCMHASPNDHTAAARKHHTGRASFLFHSGIGLSPSAARVKRCAITPRNGMTQRGAHLHGACCAHGNVPWCLGTTRAVMSCYLVLDIVSSIHVRPDTQHQIPLRPALFLYIANRGQPAPLPRASRRNKPHQHGLRRHDYVDRGTESECGSCLTRRVYFAFARL